MIAVNKSLSLVLFFMLGCEQREQSHDLRDLNQVVCKYKLIDDITGLKYKFHVEFFLDEDYLIFKITNKSPQIVSETLSLKIKTDSKKNITECQSRIEITGP